MNARDILFATPKAQRHQMVLYPQYLDEMLPADAPIRIFARILDELDWSAWEAAYVGVGQPPIHPHYLAGAILYGLMHRVRSSRELEMAACKHLDFIWFLEGFTPDHSTFAKFRVRHAKAIDELKRQIAQLLLGEREKPLLELLIDGTRLRADSDRHGARTAGTIEKIIRELDRRMEEMRRNDAQALPETEFLAGMEPDGDVAEQLEKASQEIARLETKRKQLQKALDAARRRDAKSQEHNGKNAKPVRVPVSDPDSQITPNKEGGYAPNYTPVAAIDAQTGAILYDDVLAGSDEASAVCPAVEAVEALTGEKPCAIAADGNFAAGQVLEALEAQGIEAYMPTRSASGADNPAQRPEPALPVAQEAVERLPKQGGQFARTAFVYDEQADSYHCPMGHEMAASKHGTDKDGVSYATYQCEACPGCPLAGQCIKGKATHRTITRDEHEPLREAADERMKTEEGRAIYKKRAPGIEGLFGVIKSCMGIRRFARRGLEKVRCDWSWICTAYTLKKLLARKANMATGFPQGGHPGVNTVLAGLHAAARAVAYAFFPRITSNRHPRRIPVDAVEIYPIEAAA